jgi:hypothetical protein
MSSFPPTAGVMSKVKGANQRASNRAAAESIGESADELSAPVLDRASRRIGQVFEYVRDLPKIPVNQNQAITRLVQIEKRRCWCNADLIFK